MNNNLMFPGLEDLQEEREIQTVETSGLEHLIQVCDKVVASYDLSKLEYTKLCTKT